MREGIKEVPEESRLLRFLYQNEFGRLVIKIFTSHVVSKIVGEWMDSPFSKLKIKKFIKQNNINMEDYEEKKYSSFNDFFTRKIKEGKRPINMEPKILISPCDSKLTVHTIDYESSFRIKNSIYTVSDLLAGDDVADKYTGGQILIFRLTVDDYHRYCYIDGGAKEYNKHIKGELHTVKPIATYSYNIYSRNSREYNIMHTENFGTVVQIEVGAMMVGKISNNEGACQMTRGKEKGKFEFGGSTIILLLEKGKVVIDEDIIQNSRDGLETPVKMGERIGSKL